MTEPYNADQILIRKLTEIIIANLGNENFGVNELAHASGMSLYRLSLKLQSINGKTVNQFIREVRLQKALEMLKKEQYTGSEVAYKVGFSSPSYFNKCFHEFFGYPPGEVRKMNSSIQDPDILTQGADENKPGKSRGRTYLLSFSGILFIVLVLVTAVILIYKKIQKSDSADNLISSDGRISIAVMPFQNMTGETKKNIWQGWIQDILTNSLANSEDLRIRQIENVNYLIKNQGIVNYSSITPSIASAISKKLDASVFIYGNIKEAGPAMGVYAELINSRTEEVFKSFQIEGFKKEENIFPIIDSLSMMVRNFLVLSVLKKKVPPDLPYLVSTNSPEAYRNIISGRKAFYERDFPTAIKYYSQALAYDSNLVEAAIRITFSYANQEKYEKMKEWWQKVSAKRDFMSPQQKIWADFLYSRVFETPYECIKYLKQLQEFDDQSPTIYYNIGADYNQLYQYLKAIPELERALEIYKKWDLKPNWVLNYTILGEAYHKTGQYKKEEKLYKKAEKDFPDDPEPIYYRQAILALTKGDTIEANRYVKKYFSVCREKPWGEAYITSLVAAIYSEAGFLNKSEEYYRQVLLLEPEKHYRQNDLAYFLFVNDLNLNEGMELIDSALQVKPDNWDYLHTKGWGLYKQGRYQEALKILQKSWDLRMQNVDYDHDAYLHFKEAERAVAGQK